MRIANVVIPAFDPKDEHFEGKPPVKLGAKYIFI
jgi:hypothetical protein